MRLPQAFNLSDTGWPAYNTTSPKKAKERFSVARRYSPEPQVLVHITVPAK